MNVQAEVVCMLDEVLGLHGRAGGFDADTPVLESLPDLDSMAVATLLSSIEERFGLAAYKGIYSGETLVTAGGLTTFVAERVD